MTLAHFVCVFSSCGKTKLKEKTFNGNRATKELNGTCIIHVSWALFFEWIVKGLIPLRKQRVPQNSRLVEFVSVK